MQKFFINKRTLRRRKLIKYLFVLIVIYYTLKFSIYLLNNTNILKYVYSQNKFNDYINLLTSNTINKPNKLLNYSIYPKYAKKNINSNISLMPVIKENIIKPKIYIYSTHQTEKYNDNVKTVIDASYQLKNEFEKYNIDVTIEAGNINDFLVANNMDYGYSYVASRYFIEENIKNNNYDLIIDLHRDAISHDYSYIDINGLSCAKILFVVGKEHDNYQLNLNLANYLHNLINEKYPNLSRGVMLKSGPDVNGLYNQDLSSNMILLELGGNNNSPLEVSNTINLIVPILGDYLYGK